MKFINFSIVTLAFVYSALTLAAPVAKYTGTLDFPANGTHKAAVSGTIQLLFEGEQFTQFVLKTSAPVFGKTDFPSTEQALFSNTTTTPAQMAVVFKLKGPTHTWYYVFVTTTTDQGKSFAGTFYKAQGPIDAIKQTLDSGVIPAAWTVEGKGTLKAL